MGIIERYNELFTLINRALTNEDMTELYTDIKAFISDYESIDKDMTDKIFSMYVDKLNTLVTENSNDYDVLNNKVQEIKNRQYDYKGETNDLQAVQTRTLQLMAELPKTITSANASMIKNKINATIASNAVGSKAVLELLKYPAYADMVDETMKLHALANSKSDKQKAFDDKQETDLKKATETLTSVYTQGFHLRKLREMVTGKNQMYKFH